LTLIARKNLRIITALPVLLFLLAINSQAAIPEQSDQVTLMQLEEVSDLIMSPGCNYNYTLSSCPSVEAEQMRELVKDKIGAGESTEEILDYFAGVYGPKVLAQPAKKGFYLVAWWFPYFLLFDVVLLAGVILWVWRKKSDTETDNTTTTGLESGKSEEEMDALLEQEVRKFREG
jgi:cytochrome c-type biogenesis protein CcmH/NrfF